MRSAVFAYAASMYVLRSSSRTRQTPRLPCLDSAVGIVCFGIPLAAPYTFRGRREGRTLLPTTKVFLGHTGGRPAIPQGFPNSQRGVAGLDTVGGIRIKGGYV